MTHPALGRFARSARLGLSVLVAVGGLARAQDAASSTPAAVEAAQPPPSPPAEASPAPATTAPQAAPAATATTTAPAAPPMEVTAPAAPASDASLAGLTAEYGEAGVSDVASDSYSLNAYGFMDFSFTTKLDDHLNVAVSKYQTFAVGNFNAYLEANLGDHWRTLAEVRFLYLPNGVSNYEGSGGSFGPRNDTTVPDYTDINRPLRWGGIEIERAWIEYEAHPLLTLRFGQWLTPYGIWNVDHGSPVLIGARRPYIIGDELFPERQTGIEGYGSFFAGLAKVGYHLTLSNGRGPSDSFQDLDHNKAIGGRLYAAFDGDFGTLTVGTSAYRGSYTDSSLSFAIVAPGKADTVYTVNQSFDELGLAADLKWQWQGALFQAEAITHARAYHEDGRVLSAVGGPVPKGFLPDFRLSGAYGLFGYRTPWWGVMPFASAEYYYIGMHDPATAIVMFNFGLNVRPTPRVVLKAQYEYVYFPQASSLGIELQGSSVLTTQIAWSF